MTDPPDWFANAIAAIDQANSTDPVTVEMDGFVGPKELLHSERMTHWVTELDPGASYAQLVAARAHHLRRWVVPRSGHPEGRAGYLAWRIAQRSRQVAELSGILEAVGCDTVTSQRALEIVAKRHLRSDPQVQVHEDALCLVFLELQLEELVERLGEDRVVDVLAKSIAKMSPQGIGTAAGLPMSDRGGRLLSLALRAASKPDA